MKAFTITSWKINPVNLVCLIMLSIIMVTLLTSNKPSSTHLERDTDGVVREYGKQDDEYYDTHPLTWQDMKEYQLEVTGNHVIMYDYGRVVAVLPLDNHCNLTEAIEDDNK